MQRRLLHQIWLLLQGLRVPAHVSVNGFHMQMLVMGKQSRLASDATARLGRYGRRHKCGGTSHCGGFNRTTVP